MLAGFGACGRGDCEGVADLVVTADKPCPAPEAAAERFESSYDDASVEDPATWRLVVPGTLCWYLGQVRPDEPCRNPTRDEVVESVKLRYGDPYDVLRACDGEQPLVGGWVPAEATTPSEAVAVTPPECPPELDNRFIQTGELVGQDFFPGTIICSYHIDYICNGSGGCGAPPAPMS